MTHKHKRIAMQTGRLIVGFCMTATTCLSGCGPVALSGYLPYPAANRTLAIRESAVESWTNAPESLQIIKPVAVRSSGKEWLVVDVLFSEPLPTATRVVPPFQDFRYRYNRFVRQVASKGKGFVIVRDNAEGVQCDSYAIEQKLDDRDQIVFKGSAYPTIVACNNIKITSSLSVDASILPILVRTKVPISIGETITIRFDRSALDTKGWESASSESFVFRTVSIDGDAAAGGIEVQK